MNAKSIRGWLLCQPRPVTVRIVCDDEQPRSIPIEPGQSFTSIAESIVALQPDLLEALDKDGQLIRAMRADEEEEEEQPEQGFTVPADPASAQLIIFAKLIADAYKTSTTVAFDKLGELFAMVVGREQNAAREASVWQKAFMKQVLESKAEGGGDSGGSFGDMLMQHFMSGMMKGQAEAAPKPVVNGAPTTNGAPKGDA